MGHIMLFFMVSMDKLVLNSAVRQAMFIKKCSIKKKLFNKSFSLLKPTVFLILFRSFIFLFKVSMLKHEDTNLEV